MLKELAYQAAESAPGRRIVGRLGAAVRLPFGEGPEHPPRRILLVVTVDTEGGHVARDERRIWQGSAPRSFQGYVDGVRNVTAVLERHGVKGTFFVAPHGLSATGATLASVERAILSIPRGGHEIGLHLHPSSDVALARRVGRSFGGSARDLALVDIERLVHAGRALLEDVAGDAPIDAFRWGNWALEERAARVVAAAGFRVDSSCVPGLRDRKEAPPRFDWSHEKRTAPWSIAPGLLEAPIAMFRFFGRLLRADPLYGSLVAAALHRHATRSPRGSQRPSPSIFVVMTHSTDATYADGAPTASLAALDALLAYAKAQPHVTIVTLREATGAV